MKIKHIKFWLSVFAFVYATHLTVGCTCLNENLNMYKQEGQKITGIAGQENQTNNESEVSKQLILLNFSSFFTENNIGLDLGFCNSYLQYSLEGSEIVRTFFIKQGEIFLFNDSIFPHASINLNYNKAIVEDETKSLLKAPGKLRDPEKFRKVIVDSLEAGHKVAISACTRYPHAVTATLQHIGLNESQISRVFIVFSEQNDSCYEARNGLCDKIFSINMNAALKLTQINKENMRYIYSKNNRDSNTIQGLEKLGS